MVQGPQDLPELLKSAGAAPSASAPAAGSKRNSPPSPTPTQAPDTVQLSQAGIQAAARARDLAKQADAKGAQLAHPAAELPPADRVAHVAGGSVAVPPVASPAAPAPAPVSAQPLAPVRPAVPVLSPSQAQVLQATPEVRGDRVAQAQTNLSSLSGDSSALNAKLAEKLLTES